LHFYKIIIFFKLIFSPFDSKWFYSLRKLKFIRQMQLAMQFQFQFLENLQEKNTFYFCRTPGSKNFYVNIQEKSKKLQFSSK
jgi:hypothetical protein